MQHGERGAELEKAPKGEPREEGISTAYKKRAGRVAHVAALQSQRGDGVATVCGHVYQGFQPAFCSTGRTSEPCDSRRSPAPRTFSPIVSTEEP